MYLKSGSFPSQDRKSVTSKLQSWVFILKNLTSLDATEFRIFTRKSRNLVKLSNPRALKRESNQWWGNIQKYCYHSGKPPLNNHTQFKYVYNCLLIICVNKHIILLAQSSLHKIKWFQIENYNEKLFQAKHFHDGSIMIWLKAQNIRDIIKVSILAGWCVVKGQ